MRSFLDPAILYISSSDNDCAYNRCSNPAIRSIDSTIKRLEALPSQRE